MSSLNAGKMVISTSTFEAIHHFLSFVKDDNENEIFYRFTF